MRERERERERMTYSKGSQGEIEPLVAAAGTQPVNMGRLLYQLSYQGDPTLFSYIYLIP